jgi:endonuclease III
METTLGSVKTIMDRIVCSSLKIIDEHKQTNDKMMEKNLEAVNEVLEEKKYYEQKTKELQLYCEILKEQKDYFHKHLEAAKVEME